MSTTGDEVAGWLALAGVVIGGLWLFGAFDGDEAAPTVVEDIAPMRPTGLVNITTLDTGAVWLLDADSVKGPRTARQGWLAKDYSKDRGTSYREGRELWLVNCETDAFKTLTAIMYDPGGKADTLFRETAEEAPIEYAAPSTNAAAVTRALCMEWYDTPR